MTKRETLGKILYRGLVPIILPDDLPALACLEEVLRLDIEAVEISALRPGLLELIAEARRRFPRLAIGVGSLMEQGRLKDQLARNRTSLPSIAEVVSAGADFLVSNLPFAADTYGKYAETHVLVPGVTTPGEAAEALNLGANLLRFVVPQITGGPGYLKALDTMTHRSFPFFTAGPVRFELQAGYIAAGAMASAVGFDTMLGPDYGPMQRAYDEEFIQEGLLRFLRPIERSRAMHFEEVPFASKDPVEISRISGRCLNA